MSVVFVATLVFCEALVAVHILSVGSELFVSTL